MTALKSNEWQISHGSKKRNARMLLHRCTRAACNGASESRRESHRAAALHSHPRILQQLTASFLSVMSDVGCRMSDVTMSAMNACVRIRCETGDGDGETGGALPVAPPPPRHSRHSRHSSGLYLPAGLPACLPACVRA
jgi:hypothetical protein